MEFNPSGHAGQRSFERGITKPLAEHVIAHGIVTRQPNGNLRHESRDPGNPDHIIKIVTSPNKQTIVTAIRDTTRPLSGLLSVQQHSKEKSAQDKKSHDVSRANRKAQLEKKRDRSRQARSA